MNIYGPNNRPSKYMKQNLTVLMGVNNKFTIIVGDFNMFLSVTDRGTWPKKWVKIKDILLTLSTTLA